MAADGAYEISGPKIEKRLGYTNMDSEKGFAFFQRFLREQGIIKELENMGIEDGDTVRMYDFEFDYYLSLIHIFLTPGNNHHMIEAMFKAFAKALDDACTYDSRIKDVMSTKGSL